MSFRLVAQIVETVGLDLAPKAILIAVASYAKDDGNGCFAGQQSIAKRAGCNERTARKYLKLLEQRGLLRRRHRQRRDGSRTSDEYELSVHKIATYRHVVPDGPVDNLPNRNDPSTQTARMVEPTGTKDQPNRHHVPDKNLSVESINESIRGSSQNSDHPLPISPPEGETCRDITKSDVATASANPRRSKNRQPENEAERIERIERSREWQLQYVQQCLAKGQSANTPAPVNSGSFALSRPSVLPKLNEFDRSKAAYERRAAKRAAAAARRAAGCAAMTE
jgi:hypothetical protein